MRRIIAIVVLAVCAVLAGCESPAYHFASAASAPVKVPVVHLRFPAIGVYESDEPLSYAGVAKFSAETKTPVRIAMYYAIWGDGFNTAFAVQAARHGAVTDVMLQPYGVSVAAIAKGDQDNWIRAYAAEIKAFHDPVIVSFGHEMNGCWYPWGACKTPPTTFVKAWRHIVTLFRQMKAENVSWLWEANVGPPKPLRSDYPGNSWVNLIGVTGYYTLPSSTFSNELLLTIDQIRQFASRPMIIGETGVSPDLDRPAQILNLFAGLKAFHLLAVVYFDVDQKHVDLYKQNWDLEGDSAALQAFRDGARSFGVIWENGTPRRLTVVA